MDELSLDEVFAELTDVQQQIDSLPDDNFAELHELRQRQRALKVRAQELRAATRTQDQIDKELADLHRVRDEIYERRLSTVDTGPAGGAGGGGIDIRDVHKWNEAIDATWGLAEVEARIRALELERARRAEDD